jgi:XTP/dITP diphosphohydrolase
VRAVLATKNLHKLVELRAALPGWQIESLEAEGWPEETGENYEENARLKARFAREHAEPEEWALGEDSGIECEALGGAPGLHSARWAPHGNQADVLLDKLEGQTNRRARMIATLVAIAPGGEELTGRGVLDGKIAHSRCGDAGFGYDPIFVPGGQDRTVGERGAHGKREHSHRGRAAAALAARLADAGGANSS